MLDGGSLRDSGPFLSHVCELRAELEMGLTVTRDDLLQSEFLAIMILREEEDKWRAVRKRYQEAAEHQPRPGRRPPKKTTSFDDPR